MLYNPMSGPYARSVPKEKARLLTGVFMLAQSSVPHAIRLNEPLRDVPCKGSFNRIISRWRRRLAFEQQRLGVFKQFLDAHEETYGLAAVDDAVVVGQREIHHRAYHDLTFDHDGPFFNLMHA